MQALRRFLPRSAEKSQSAAGDEPLPLAVLEFQSPTAAVIATPLPALARSTNYTISAMVLLLLLLAMVVKTDRIVVAPGELVSVNPDISVQAFNAQSIVRDIKVHQGDIVQAGQVLATLDPTYTAADLTSMTQQEQNDSAQVAELQALENKQPYVPDAANPYSGLAQQTYNQMQGAYSASLDNYTQQISQLQQEIQGYKQQEAYYSQRLAIASNVETMRKKLQQLQVGSELDTEAATDDRVNMQQQLSSARSSADADEKQLASVQAQRDAAGQQFRAQVSTQLATALNNLAQARQELAKARLNDQLVDLTAPQDAVVQSVAPIAVGAVLNAGQQVFDLAPINAPFVVTANIDATQSGYAHVGNPVVIKFATLPELQYGSAKGTVISISPESVNPASQQDVALNGPPVPGTPQNSLYYIAQISVDELNLHNVPPGFRLMPGMPVEADLLVGKRTILEYLIQRVMPVAYNAMHEP
ncbi:HlyD family type I secretion periplasmic adaptor subunit [Acidocella sp.]|uniref:HlyD family type I secretion periplasmic adaptor subunit n=1 Tax=Acidocella sp. TaxID=50710 RepID=UPI0026340E7D|nr:HlyD family type I secretion periplasmic adaptor subunit [Acidocella sp.]